MLLCLSSCDRMAVSLSQPEAASLPAIEIASSEEAETPESAQVIPSTVEPTQEAASAEANQTTEPTTEPVVIGTVVTVPTKPTTEPATVSPDLPRYQSGDTTPTWRPEMAEQYPSDTRCSVEQLLEKWMNVEGLTMADLDERDCKQLVLVVAQPADGVETITVCYERESGGQFTAVNGLAWLRGHIGKNGLRHNRQRNTNTSPAGLWALSFAFGNELPPEGLKLPWRQVTPNSDWVCDENSPYFNTWQERDDPTLTPWSDDVEHLADYPSLYAYACVIEYNRPPDVVPDRGCAIFFHCSDRGTGGCVSLPQEDFLYVLRWLDSEKNPFILITGSESGT